MGRLQIKAEGRIDLGIGQPDLRLLPLDALARAAAHRLSIPETDILQYGPERGSTPMREKLGRFLDQDPERLFITQGASHALDLVLGRYAREGDTVLVEDPTYFHALKILRARRVRIVPVPMDQGGIDVRALEEISARERPKLLYTIPIHHNPTSATLGNDRRSKLVELARVNDFLIASDDVYQLMTYEGVSPPLMSTLDPRVLSLGSFSKIFAPGLRMGWIDAHPDHHNELENCGVLRSGGGASPIMSAILESALETGILSEYLIEIREEYGARCRAMTEALDDLLAPLIAYEKPTGGFFVWLKLVSGADAEALLPRAHAAGVGFLPGSRASIEGTLSDRIRLCFTYYDRSEIRTAIARLAKILN